jgi:nickel/cobalt transporter (NicO) family protein
MRRALILAGLPVGLVLLALWWTGGFAGLLAWVAEVQRQTQTALAGAVRALRAGEPGALAALLGVCFTYGVLHAAGPGHGKALIGAYGVAARVPVMKLSLLALISSLAQAAVAVLLVYAAVALLGLTRDAATGLAEGAVPALGNLIIAGLGLWLLWRGVQGIRRQGVAEHGHSHDHHRHDHGGHANAHDHDHGAECGCGHAHGPTVAQVEGLTNWRDTALLVGGIAMRPCTGALFLLILTWQIGIGAAGIAGAFVMGLGVAAVTMAVAVMAVWAREGAFSALSGGVVARAVPVVEALAGALIAAVAIVLLWRGL